MEYKLFITKTVSGINQRYEQAERSLYDLAKYVKEKVTEGVNYGKTKEMVYRDLSKHPNFKLTPDSLKRFGLTQSFLEKTGALTPQLPISSVSEIAKARLTQEDKEIILKIAEDKKMSQSQIRREIKVVQRKNRSIEGEKVKLPVNAQIINKDFRKVKVDPVDLILTDPPYPGEFLPLWKDLADFAMRALKPSGFLVAYSGQYHLPEVFKALDGELIYYWTFCLYHTGATQIVNARNVMCKWKPILVFQKPPFKKLGFTPMDLVESENREKEGHDWQQSESAVVKLIETFSSVGDTVLDPMCGAGTFPFVAHKLNRKAIGIEIDSETFNIAKSRFND